MGKRFDGITAQELQICENITLFPKGSRADRVRRIKDSGVRVPAIAQYFGVCKNRIYQILRG